MIRVEILGVSLNISNAKYGFSSALVVNVIFPHSGCRTACWQSELMHRAAAWAWSLCWSFSRSSRCCFQGDRNERLSTDIEPNFTDGCGLLKAVGHYLSEMSPCWRACDVHQMWPYRRLLSAETEGEKKQAVGAGRWNKGLASVRSVFLFNCQACHRTFILNLPGLDPISAE